MPFYITFNSCQLQNIENYIEKKFFELTDSYFISNSFNSNLQITTRIHGIQIQVFQIIEIP